MRNGTIHKAWSSRNIMAFKGVEQIIRSLYRSAGRRKNEVCACYTGWVRKCKSVRTRALAFANVVFGRAKSTILAKFGHGTNFAKAKQIQYICLRAI